MLSSQIRDGRNVGGRPINQEACWGGPEWPGLACGHVVAMPSLRLCWPVWPACSLTRSCIDLCCVWEPRCLGAQAFPAPGPGPLPPPLLWDNAREGAPPPSGPASRRPVLRGPVHPPRSPVTYDTALGDTHQWTFLQPSLIRGREGGHIFRKEARGVEDERSRGTCGHLHRWALSPCRAGGSGPSFLSSAPRAPGTGPRPVFHTLAGLVKSGPAGIHATRWGDIQGPHHRPFLGHLAASGLEPPAPTGPSLPSIPMPAGTLNASFLLQRVLAEWAASCTSLAVGSQVGWGLRTGSWRLRRRWGCGASPAHCPSRRGCCVQRLASGQGNEALHTLPPECRGKLALFHREARRVRGPRRQAEDSGRRGPRCTGRWAHPGLWQQQVCGQKGSVPNQGDRRGGREGVCGGVPGAWQEGRARTHTRPLSPCLPR